MPYKSRSLKQLQQTYLRPQLGEPSDQQPALVTSGPDTPMREPDPHHIITVEGVLGGTEGGTGSYRNTASATPSTQYTTPSLHNTATLEAQAQSELGAINANPSNPFGGQYASNQMLQAAQGIPGRVGTAADLAERVQRARMGQQKKRIDSGKKSSIARQLIKYITGTGGG